jgi:predicted transcriptional regulator
MTLKMKKWLHEHGLTAVQVAQKAGLLIPDMYRQLSGTMPVNPALRDTLCGIYGMTSAEYREAIP